MMEGHDLEGAAPTSSSAISLTSSSLPTAAIVSGDDAIPVGLTLSPLAPLPNDLVLEHDVLRCEQCGGYIGPHCDVFHNAWRCGMASTYARLLRNHPRVVNGCQGAVISSTGDLICQRWEGRTEVDVRRCAGAAAVIARTLSRSA